MVLKLSEYPSAGQSKALQNIVAFACWMEVVEQETTSSKNLHSILERIYFGDEENEDLVAKKKEFLLGTGRFRHIWSEDLTRIHPDFQETIIGGLTHRQISESDALSNITVTGKMKLGEAFITASLYTSNLLLYTSKVSSSHSFYRLNIRRQTDQV